MEDYPRITPGLIKLDYLPPLLSLVGDVCAEPCGCSTLGLYDGANEDGFRPGAQSKTGRGRPAKYDLRDCDERCFLRAPRESCSGARVLTSPYRRRPLPRQGIARF